MSKVFTKDDNRILVADDATTDQFGGGWTEEAPVVIYPTAEEVRAERDALLLASDADWAECTSLFFDNSWTMEEWHASEHCQGWADYRKALRDIPGNEGFPQTVVWPTKPGGTE